MPTHAMLDAYVSNRTLVQIVRPALEDDDQHLVGVPVAFGRDWLVISRLSDEIALDGFDALRMADITAIHRTFRRRSFYVGGLRQKRVMLPLLPKLDLGSANALLRSAQQQFSLLLIQRELTNPGEAEVGRVLRASSRTYSMRLISPGARWISAVARRRTSDITRIAFAGEYEETLAAVAGLADPKWT